MTERHEQPVAGGPLSVDNDADYLMLSAFGSAAGSITDIPVLRQHERDAAAAEACSDQPVTLVQSLPARPRYADRLVLGDACTSAVRQVLGRGLAAGRAEPWCRWCRPRPSARRSGPAR